MTQYRWHDGFTFDAADASQVIATLRKGATYPEHTFDEYLDRLAFRAGEYSGKPHRNTSAEALVADLIESGMLTRIQ